ncbi:dihydrofolate reductase [Candidatus Nomurabacteria bacterium]|nr:dihydrofolate reductase [Candidatus Nomurabacteria bacterium]
MIITKPVNSIVACDFHMTIGHGPEMPGWQITDDYLLNFIPKTKGDPCIMGSITAKTLISPLKGRPCIAVTTNRETREWLYGNGFIVTNSYWEALLIAQKIPEGKAIWNIGGGQTYKWFRENVPPKEIHITKIQNTYPGENEIKFCGFPEDQYNIDLSRSLEIKKRLPKTNNEKDRGNTDDAIVEVYVREY